MSLEQLLQGLGIGIGLTIMVGPITLTIIDSSLTDGWKAGLATSLAMWTSDFMFIFACFYGSRELFEQFSFVYIDGRISLVAGAILLTIGVTLWVVRKNRVDIKAVPQISHMAGHMLRGFLVNTLSPFTLFFWPTIITSMVLQPELTNQRAILLFTGMMLPIIGGDVLKAFFADWIRQRITDKYMQLTRGSIAIIFIFAGVVMLIKGI